MPDATITSTASTFGTISGTFAADQSTVTGTVTGLITGTLTGSVGVPGPAGPAGAGVPAGGTEGQIIVKQSATDYDTAWADNAAETLTATVRNETGATLAKGTVVYISGAAGNKALVSKASASSEATSSKTFAILSEEIPNNQNGQSVTVGLLKGLDTSALTEGGSLWLSTTAGQWTQTMPTAPNHAVFLGTVTRVHANQGTVEVRIQNGYELQELHNVKITSVANGQVLKYDSAQSLWVNGTDSSGVAWGAITGTLSSQTDLQTALDGKYSTSNPAGYITSSALTGYALESWVTAGFYPLTGNPSGFLTSASLTPYLTKADNLGSLTSFSTARDNLGIGTANTPVFAGLTVQGSGANVANLTPTSLTLTHATAGQFTIQPSQGIVFPDSTIQTTAYTGTAAATWGSITGTLSAQTDLQSALDGKYSTTNPAGYIDSSALTGYATESWVTAGFYPLTGNPSGFLTSASLTGYAQLSGATFTGKVNFKAGTTSSASINLAPGVAPTSPSTGDIWFDSSSSKVVFRSSALTQAIASEVWVTSQGYLTSASLSGYATESWVTSNFYPLSGNPSNFATESWVTSYGFLTDAPSDGNQYVRLNGSWSTLSVPADYITSVSSPLSVTAGDLSIDLSAYLTTSTAASTYQTQAAMSAYLTSASAATTYAPLASPALTGTPTAPTAAVDTNTTQVATTAYVVGQGYLKSATASSTYAPLASPALTGTPTAPTATAGTSTTQIATTAFVTTADNLKANLASPTFTGTPAAPTASAGTNTTQIATTAFVTAAVPAFGDQSDINEPLSTTKSASIDNVREMLLSPAYQTFYQGLGVNGTSGTGAAVNANSGRWKEYVGPNSAVAGHAKGVFDTTASSIGFAGYQRGANLTSRNWSKKIWMSGRCMIGHFSLTTYNGSANSFARISLGGYTAIGAGDMSAGSKGIGWKLQGGGSSALQLQVSNGSTVTTVSSSFTPTLKQVFDWEIYSDGAGNVTLYVNDSQVATTTAGPTGTSTSGLYMEGIDATASSTSAFILNNLGTKIYYGI